ncbi:unnamed protein product [Adineta steineri]|uniref:Uncharacterized protein n=1 Tax=Adineta steineri TaxID=433720 RepID=A0A814LP76_9BILA|nr:unnamed protein product [Adineta steineri]CAF1067754.1 unnamed protein product [Adineta steineri]
MATAVLPNDDFYTNTDDKCLEIFSLIWLDANINVKDTRDTEMKLRFIINHIKKFKDVKQCQHYIEQTSQKDRLILIVSGRFGRELVPYIHQLRQVISIYVYCMDKNSNEQWALKFVKVISVVVDLDELVSQITRDHKIQKKVEEPLPIYTFTTNVDAGNSTTGVNGQFVFSQVLIDCLLRLKSTEIDKNELINCCQNEYEGNSWQLNNLHEFEKDYTPDKVVWWYTRESFFYKTLNAALRTQNIHMIFLFRTFIYDIYRQLQKYQSKHPLQVYRSQLMSWDELDSLKNNIGQYISINSMFSTSKQRTTALFLLGDITTKSDLERVLFEIDADPKIATTKPFADISKHSYFPDESEVLFMIGSIFRLNNIKRNGDQIWIIKMTLCNDNEHDLKQVLMYMKQQIENEEINLRTLGNVLWEMGKFDLAEKYFIRLLKQLPSDDPLHISLYEDLGKLASQRGAYDMSMKWRQKLLTFKEENLLATNASVNKTNNSIDEPDKMHVAPHNGYSIKNTREFIIRYGPYLRTTLKITQVLLKLESFVIPQLDSVSDPVDTDIDTMLPILDKQKEMEQQLNLVGKLLDRVDHRWAQPKSTIFGQHKSRGVPLQGADLRDVETYLSVVDNKHSLGNLYRTVTVDGHVHWVCREHYDDISFNNAMFKYIDQLEAMGGEFDTKTKEAVVSSKDLSRKSVKILRKALTKGFNVLKLTFKECTLKEDDLAKLLNVVINRSSVRCLNMFAVCVSNLLGNTKYVCKCMTAEFNNQSFQVRFCDSYQDGHTSMLTQLLQQNKIRRMFDFSASDFMGHERELQKCFETKGMVTGLIMEHSNNIDVIDALFNSKMKTLYQLKFNNSLQVPSTLSRFCEMLKTNQTLKEIDIMDQTGFEDETFIVNLLNTVKEHKSIKHLSLHVKNIQQSDRKEASLSESLKNHQFISRLQQSVLFNHININTKWKQHGITIAGGNGRGNQLNQLSRPQGIYVNDDHQTIYIADFGNDRIVEWKYGAKNGQVVAGGNEKGDRSDQLNYPTDVIVDKKNNSLIICDYGNKRLVRWSRQNGENGETIISDIHCYGLTIDKNVDLYVSDYVKNEVRRWKQGEKEGTIVVRGNGKGKHLNQFHCPTHIFVDKDHSVYVSDSFNNRVMKWMKGAKEGIVVASGKDEGNSLTQLSSPYGCEGSCEGSIVVGENGKGAKPNQFRYPTDLSFDVQGNLYVVDHGNHRIQKFYIDLN